MPKVHVCSECEASTPVYPNTASTRQKYFENAYFHLKPTATTISREICGIEVK
jgi:hypothetical protein